MDEPAKSALFPVPVRWFEIPLDGMKRGFTHLKKRVDQLVNPDRLQPPDSPVDKYPPDPGNPPESSEPVRSGATVGVHLDTYA